MIKRRQTNVMKTTGKQTRQTTTKQKSAFNVFEIGMGREPLTLIRKAQRSILKKKNRVFVGTDKELNLNESLRIAGIKKLPKNLTLVQQCAIDALMKANPESQHVIFGSYLVNNLSKTHSSCFIRGLACEKAIFVAAEKALKPGGRLILVQDRDMSHFMDEAAFNLGLRLHAIPLTDAQIAKSESWAIQMRGTKEKRIEYIRDSGISLRELEADAQHRKLKSVDELARPTIFILGKPREGQQKRIELSDVHSTSVDRELDLINDLLGRLFGL
jgi:hypothetical protein